MKDTPVWVYDKNVGVRPGNDLAQAAEIDATATLFVLELPESPEGWTGMVSGFTGLERIYLLHSPRAPHERIEPPSRDHFKLVYSLIHRGAGQGLREEDLIAALAKRTGWSKRMVEMSLGVFEELGFIIRASGTVRIHPSPSKQALERQAVTGSWDCWLKWNRCCSTAGYPKLPNGC
ncbi:hypothetical protein HMSSN139_56230 [Paenibacillus sp. HMSSN-139]|nr:hypothetical protein HMSSN139_56230 [Paenibacillus sp. HMSSN-139]